MRVADVIDLIEGWYPPHRAESWDAVGLVCGDPDAEVRSVLLAVDPVLAVAEEAVARDADLLIVHHPLYLKGTTTVAAGTPKGRVVHQLLAAGCGLLTAHTNADSPTHGVSAAIAEALGLRDVVPLDPDPVGPRDKLVVFVPGTHAEVVRDALARAGAGRIGGYDSASFSAPGEGRFRPLPGADPTIGAVGNLEVVDEVRIEVVAERRLRSDLVSAMLAVHPYEVPAYDVVELAEVPDADCGSGRIGRLAEPLTLRAFAELAATVFPPTAAGLRVAGDPDGLVEVVALCGGSGDFLLDRARSAGADVYVTSDLRHHPASEAREAALVHGGPALVDVAHSAAESLWLPVLRRRLVEAVGDTVAVHVSTTNTDPWTFRV